MFLQIKAIRKGCKPPIWRRAYLPLHITFSQMACILELLLELPQTNQFEFEFYQEKDRLVERQENESIPHSYEYSYWDARNSCVDDWLLTKTWFTFRIREAGKPQPEYRVESEKLFKEIRFNADNHEILAYPVILKEVSVKDDAWWNDGMKTNRTLKESCFLKNENPGYPSFAEIAARVQNQQGIAVSPNMKSRDHLLRQSPRSIMGELGDSLMQMAAKKQNMPPGTAASANHSGQGARKNATMLEMLNSYTKKDLMEAAEETGCTLTASVKPKMAFELARHLLEPDIMRILLMDLTEEELDTFETAIRRKRFLPTAEEWEDLAKAYDLNYIAEYSDDTVEVPSDAVIIYELICKHGYRQYHKDIRWMIDCLAAFALLYVVGPVRLLFRMYRQKEGSLNDYKGFLRLLEKVPSNWNPCSAIGEKLVVKEAMEDDIYREIEARQRDVPYYLPGEKEIREYAAHGYPVSESAYAKLSSFFRKELKLENSLCDELCRRAFGCFSIGGMLSDYVDELKERGITFSSERQMGEFAKIIMDLNNQTRKFELKGHTPKEMLKLMPSPMSGSRPVIVPMSSLSAKMLEEGRSEWSALGMEVDTDRTAAFIPAITMPKGIDGKTEVGIKKIYPNDPCPCGSGKKYKKCCGRK